MTMRLSVSVIAARFFAHGHLLTVLNRNRPIECWGVPLVSVLRCPSLPTGVRQSRFEDLMRNFLKLFAAFAMLAPLLLAQNPATPSSQPKPKQNSSAQAKLDTAKTDTASPASDVRFNID